ncbi:MAG: tetratricopeptide repeat protein [Acidobacteriota bacterium]
MPRQYPACLVLAATLVLALASCARREQPEAQNQYIDARVCSSCHKGIAQTYSETGMAKSFYAPEAASVPNSKPYFHPASSTWYQIVAKDGGWFQRWWQIGPKGRAESVGESKIDYVIGSGNHVRTYLHRTARGTLIELPLAWYAEKGGSWALNPGLDDSDPPIGRKVGYDCMFCHNSYPSIPSGHDDAGAEPVFAAQLPQGIDCQRCHGPGGNHVKAVSQSGAKLDDIRSAIVNPRRLSNERSMEICMQCHLETTSAPLPNVIRRYDRGPFSYRPGEPLSAFQLTFDHASGSGRENKFEIVSAAYRLRQSKCFLQSNDKLGCTTCHNPHDIQHGQQGVDGYNKACAQCHASSQLAGQLASQSHPSGSNCVGCHMPKRRTEDVIHAVMTDHLIQRQPPSNLLAEFPERHGPGLQWTEYRGEVIPYGDKDGLYTAVAQVTHKSNLEAGIPKLQAEIAKRKPERPEFYLELGDALERAGRAEEAAAPYRVAIEKRPVSALLWARLAQALRASGKTQEPLDAMLKSVQADPNDAENWYHLALLQSELGDKKSAIESFQKSIALDPEFAESRSDLGVVLAEMGQLPEAEGQLQSALSIRPALPGAHAYLGYLLANRGDYAGAISHFERAGDGAFNQLNYGITLARMNRSGEARSHLEKSLAVDANQPVAHELLGELLEVARKIPDAVSHYQAAVRLRPDFGRAHVQLGAVLARQGDRTGAAAEFRVAQSDPDPQIREIAAKGLIAVGAN